MISSTDELKPVLVEMLEDLQEKVDYYEENRERDRDLEGAGYTNHQADDASQVFDQARDLTFLRRSQNRLREVKDALERMEAGTYGICENCGQPIDLARLEAIPYTTLCLSCAEAREYRGG